MYFGRLLGMMTLLIFSLVLFAPTAMIAVSTETPPPGETFEEEAARLAEARRVAEEAREEARRKAEEARKAKEARENRLIDYEEDSKSILDEYWPDWW